MFLSKIIKFKLSIFIFIALTSITTINILGGYFFLSGPLDKEKTIIIKSDLSIQKISELLEQENIIKHKKLFEIISHLYSYRSPLKSGEYSFTSGITPYQVIRKLVNGKSITHRLFIPEGYTVKEILDRINSERRLDGKIIGSNTIPEGYLMPSTYFYSYGDKREKIINLMRNKMSRTLDEIMLRIPENSPLKTRKEILIMASIIEKEAGCDDERTKIAAVFLNRLKKGMKLQADPTTIYAITNGKYRLKRLLTRKDLKIKSPYNTYHVYGLPMGAISCPGRASLEAVISPAKTDALYFVANGKGSHIFSKSLKEHNQNIQRIKEKFQKSK